MLTSSTGPRQRCCTSQLYGIGKATSQPGEWPVTWVGVAGFGPAASSSRSQVASLSASAAARLAWDRPSVDVRWRPPLSVAIVTHFVTRWLLGRPRPGEHLTRRSPCGHPHSFRSVRDLGEIAYSLSG
jgi:hypothetical protein